MPKNPLIHSIAKMKVYGRKLCRQVPTQIMGIRKQLSILDKIFQNHFLKSGGKESGFPIEKKSLVYSYNRLVEWLISRSQENIPKILLSGKRYLSARQWKLQHHTPLNPRLQGQDSLSSTARNVQSGLAMEALLSP